MTSQVVKTELAEINWTHKYLHFKINKMQPGIIQSAVSHSHSDAMLPGLLYGIGFQ